jgi:hypothetical protein
MIHIFLGYTLLLSRLLELVCCTIDKLTEREFFKNLFVTHPRVLGLSDEAQGLSDELMKKILKLVMD